MPEFLDVGLNPWDGGLDLFDRQFTIEGAPVLPTLGLGGGKVFYVDPTNGSDNNTGKGPNYAVATLAKAISKCVASRGDVIVRLPGTETVTSTVTLNCSGVTIVCTAGAGNVMKPKSFLLTNSTTGPALTITAPCNIFGMQFRAINTPAGNCAVMVDSTDVLLQGCIFQHAGGAIVGVEINGASDVSIRHCWFKDYTAAGDSPLHVVIDGATVASRFNVTGCRFINCLQCIEHEATALPTEFEYASNIMYPSAVATYFLNINTVGSAYGVLCDNYIPLASNDVMADVNQAGLVALGVHLMGNHYEEA
jgi:hypothetical protein